MTRTIERALAGAFALFLLAGILVSAGNAQEVSTPVPAGVSVLPASVEDTDFADPETKAAFIEMAKTYGPTEPEPMAPGQQPVMLAGFSDAAVADATSTAFTSATEQRLAKLEEMLNKAPAPSAAPAFPKVQVSGFAQLDTGYFTQPGDNRAAVGDVQDGSGFRRTRLLALGSVAEFTNYTIEMDFAGAGRPSFMDVWGEQTHLPYVGALRIGQYRQPFSMDALTSIRRIDFLERALPFQAFVPFRRIGAMLYDGSEDQMTTWAYGMYRSAGFINSTLGDSRFATDLGDNGGYSFSGRLTHLLHYDEPAEGRYLLHAGMAYNYSRLTHGTLTNGDVYRARAIPEFFVGDPTGGGVTSLGTPFFVDTGNLAIRQYSLFGGELAGQNGPFHFQAEYIATLLDQENGNPNVFYNGAYAQCGYFLTGENRTYDRKWGVFDKVVPFSDFFALGRRDRVCGWGAWELSGRWSYVNLINNNAVPIPAALGPPNAAPVPANPGRLNNLTAGLSWYWNVNTMMQFNYIHGFLDNQNVGNSQYDLYATRFQVAF